MLSASDIYRMRQTVGEAMPGTAVYSDMASVSDGMGGNATSWAAAGTVDARLDYGLAGISESEFAGRLGGRRAAQLAAHVLLIRFAQLSQRDGAARAVGPLQADPVAHQVDQLAGAQQLAVAAGPLSRSARCFLRHFD